MLKQNKYFRPALLLSSVVFFLSACAGGAPEQDTYGDTQVEEVQPGAVEAARDEAMAQEDANHETRKKIFEAKTELGLPTQGDDEASQ